MTDTAPAPAEPRSAIDPEALVEIADDLVRRAMKAGADAAEAGLVEGRALEASIRNGALEDLERSESRDAGLRVFVGKRQAGVAFSDLSEAGRTLAVERALAMARVAPEDRYCGLVEPGELARSIPDIPLYEDRDWDPDVLERLGLAMEEAALKVEHVETIASAGASFGAGAGALVTSNGFSLRRPSSTRVLRFPSGTAAYTTLPTSVSTKRARPICGWTFTEKHLMRTSFGFTVAVFAKMHFSLTLPARLFRSWIYTRSSHSLALFTRLLCRYLC